MSIDIDIFDDDIPDDVRAMLGEDEDDMDRAEQEQRLIAAVAAAPDNLALRIAAYAFYFYDSRLQEAIPHGDACLALAARGLGIAEDWRQVSPESATFSGFERPQRVYLKSLYALGYCWARLGEDDIAEEMLRKAASLDPEDRVGATELADLVARRAGRLPAAAEEDAG
jgi:hypothetical protein